MTQDYVAPTAPVAVAPVAAASVAAATAPLAVESKKNDGERQRRIVALGTVLSLLLGIGGAFLMTHRADASSELVADAPIGPQGGTIPFNDGGQLQVPQGAVKQPQRVIVRKTIIRERVRVVNNNTTTGSNVSTGNSRVVNVPAVVQQPLPVLIPIYTFFPGNITFLTPAVLTFPLPPGAIAARIFAYVRGRLQLITVLPNQGGFVQLRVLGFRNGIPIVA
jgi:hypothetical protein